MSTGCTTDNTADFGVKARTCTDAIGAVLKKRPSGESVPSTASGESPTAPQPRYIRAAICP
ncbi:hypothetical protein, partial [Demequina sediminicola]|uniref:hypothetical protein n=1 Tax=Demequina sediminicola TaxID=1095026 RepID=UPI001F342237